MVDICATVTEGARPLNADVKYSAATFLVSPFPSGSPLSPLFSPPVQRLAGTEILTIISPPREIKISFQ